MKLKLARITSAEAAHKADGLESCNMVEITILCASIFDRFPDHCCRSIVGSFRTVVHSKLVVLNPSPSKSMVEFHPNNPDWLLEVPLDS